MTNSLIPLSLKAIARLDLSFGLLAGNSDRWHRRLVQIKELEVYGPLETWESALRPQLPPDAYLQRLLAFLKLYTGTGQPKPWRKPHKTPQEAFLAQELQAFIDRTDESAQKRNRLLAELAIPQKKLKRIHELCFIPGILFERCLAIVEWCDQAHPAVVKEQQRLRALYRQVQNNPLLSAPLKERMQQEVDALLEFLKLEYPTPTKAAAWRKQLGIDKRLTIDTRKQGIWSAIFKELVDLLRPFCIQGSPKAFTLREDARSMPDRAYTVASRLMYLAQPDLWPDNPTLVKQRYQSTR